MVDCSVRERGLIWLPEVLSPIMQAIAQVSLWCRDRWVTIAHFRRG